MDPVGVAGTLVCAIARAMLVALQTGPANGTGGGTTDGTNTTTNGTNTTDASNGTNVSAPEQIDEGTQRTVGFLGDLWPDWLPTIPLWLVRLLLALVVLLVAWYLSKLVVRLLRHRITEHFQRPSVVQTVLGSIRSAIMLGAAFIAVGVAGLLQVSDLAISATVLTGVTILALAPIISSVVSGVLIIADRPYEIGDMIEFVDSTDRNQSGQQGFVEDITLRYTKVFTLDNTFIIVPNGSIRDRDVINYSAEDPRTRLRLDVLVSYEGDLEEARDLIEQAAQEADVVVSGGPDIPIGSARYPARPRCYINEFADHGVLLTLRYWAREPYKLLTVRSRVQENVWATLEDADVEMAYPHAHLVFDETSGSLPVSLGDGTEQFDDGERRSGTDPADDPGVDDRRSQGRWQGRRAPPSYDEGSE